MPASQTRCVSCNSTDTCVTETRKTKDGFTRRRRECESCDKRWTTYEVDQEFYQRAVSMMKPVKELIELVADTSDGCVSCTFNVGGRCSFSLPEFGTKDSKDCSYYEAG